MKVWLALKYHGVTEVVSMGIVPPSYGSSMTRSTKAGWIWRQVHIATPSHIWKQPHANHSRAMTHFRPSTILTNCSCCWIGGLGCS